jgi:hypothetical protein
LPLQMIPIAWYRSVNSKPPTNHDDEGAAFL